MKRLALALLALAACSEGTVIDIDKTDLDGYQDWTRTDVTGDVPGHGDSYRIIYSNRLADEGRIDNDGEWQELTVLIKEVHELKGDGSAGSLRYTAIMRKLALSDTPDGAELQTFATSDGNGWLFTYLDGGVDSDEEWRSSCWDECHVASPYGGAFLDYGGE